jgi:uncharacterized membrane protein
VTLESPDERLKVEREVRASIAFEHMAAAAVGGGALSAAGFFTVRVVTLIAGGSGAGALLDALLHSIVFGVVTFLVAFAAAIAVFTPLYVFLEKNRIRTIWPFHLAALFVQLAVLAALGLAPGFGAFHRFLYLLPGFLIVALFARRISPLWRAADRAAAEQAPLRLVQ